MDYDPEQGEDDRSHGERQYDDRDVDRAAWDAFETYIDRANALSDHIREDSIHTPNTWGWPKWMFNVAAGVLEDTDIDRHALEAIREDTAAQDEMDDWRMHDLFLSAGYAQLEDEEIVTEEIPTARTRRKRYPLFQVPEDQHAVFDVEDRMACIGYFASGTVINEGRVRTMGSAHTDGVLINRGTAEYMWNDDGIMLNEGDVDSFNGYPYMDNDGLSINYGSAHSLSNGGGVMINFGDTEPEPFRRYDGTFQGLFHNMVGSESDISINYGSIASDGYEPESEDVQTMEQSMADEGPDDPSIIERKTGMGITSEGVFIAVEDPDNGLYRDADTVIGAEELRSEEYEELYSYLRELEDRIGPDNPTDEILAELQAMEPDPTTRIQQEVLDRI